MDISRKIRLLPWLLGAAVLAAVVIVVLRSSEERAFVDLVEQAQPWWVIWALLLQAATYVVQGEVWRIVLHRGGAHLPLSSASGLSVAKLFVDQALPTMGVSGTVVVAGALEKRGIPRPTVMSAIAVDTAGYYIGYVLNLAFALAIVTVQGHAAPLVVAIAALFFVFGAAVVVAVLKLSGRSPGVLGTRLAQIPGIRRGLELLAQADPRLAHDPSLLVRATALQIFIAVLDAATLWVLIRSLGVSADPGVVFGSFMIASLLRSFGFVPGGLGTFEAASVTTLSLAGIPVHVGLSATLLFRGLSFWLPMLPGVIFSRQAAAGGSPGTRAPVEGPYWSRAAESVAQELDAGAAGLSSVEAGNRLEHFGANEIEDRGRLTRLGVLWNQLHSPLLLLLLFAAGLSVVTGEWVDAAIVTAIVIASAGIGYSREYRAQVAAAELRARVQVRANVLRDGQATSVPFTEIAPGDVVLLSAGSLVPADGVVLEAVDCFVNEAMLTGESFPVAKEATVHAPETPLARRSNCLYMGTNVRSGSARCLVVATGAATEIGDIAGRLTLRPPETEFERGIRHFGYLLMTAMTVMVLVVLAVNVTLGRPLVETLMFSIALAVGLSPELLPAILSVNLARGARSMAAAGVLVRRLNAIENLGSMDVLCTDKTGTLTEGVVRVHGAWDVSGATSPTVLEAAAINAALQTGLVNPLDQAILQAHSADLAAVEKVGEVPYDFVRKRLSVCIRDSRGVHMLTKGACAEVLGICTSTPDGTPIDEPARDELRKRVADWNAEGIRVLAVATRDLADAEPVGQATEQAMRLEGFLTFLDRPKEGVEEALADLGRLGVAVKLITGDAGAVARHVATSVGLRADRILTGRQLDELHDEALWRAAESTDLFVEVDPNQKERIILSLKKTGHVVGFLGDGINDAPAMHAADTSLSVEGAVDVAREAADFVLLQRDLDVIRRGVEEGRRTFANTLKYVLTTTSANLGNMISMAVVSLFLPFLPMLAGQILLNNFLSDIPAVGIADDSVDPELVERPRRWDMNFLSRFMVEFGLLSSLFDFLTFGVLLLGFAASQPLFRTAWFVESLLTELVIALVVRTRRPFYRSRPGAVLLWSSLAVMVIACVIPYLPRAALLGFTPLPASLMYALAAIVLAYVAATELLKRRFYGAPAHSAQPA